MGKSKIGSTENTDKPYSLEELYSKHDEWLKESFQTLENALRRAILESDLLYEASFNDFPIDIRKSFFEEVELSAKSVGNDYYQTLRKIVRYYQEGSNESKELS